MAAEQARTFRAPTTVVAGLGTLDGTAALLREIGGEGPFALVADRGVAEAGLLERVRACAAPLDLHECALVDPDPGFAAAEAIAAEAREAGCRAVLGVGGGSGLGAAKSVALALANEVPLERLEGRGVAEHAAVPCLAIPTTAGSGSEVSDAFVLKRDDGEGSQAVIRGAGYEPRVAILDATLLHSLPRRPMLFAGLDALSHALEALWARGASRITDALALHAGDLICDLLPAAIAERRDADLQALLEASATANLACGSAGLGLAHALSAASSVRLPHGYQNGVLLPHVAAFNHDALGTRGQALVERLAGLYEELGFEAAFAPADLSEGDTKAMAAAAAGHAFRANNARPSGDSDLHDLLTAAGAPAAKNGGQRDRREDDE